MSKGYREDGTPLFQIKNREDKNKQAERAQRIEEEQMKRRWDLGRMFMNAVRWVKNNPTK